MAALSWSSPAGEHALEAREAGVWPLDEHNAALLDAVYPLSWPEPQPEDTHSAFDLIAIGSGAGGLVTSKQSAKRGARSALISGHLAGGDCLNVGCVPSKALLHVARAAKMARKSAAEGLLVGPDAKPLPAIGVDFPATMERLRRLRASIAPADSHVATEATGSRVFQGYGTFTGPNTVEVNGKTLTFKKAVICTGGKAHVPSDVPGLAEAPYCTNDTLFNLTELPPRMVIVGAGAIGLEMAQAFAVFGSHVTVLVRSRSVLARAGDAAGRAIQRVLEADGVTFKFGAKIVKVTSTMPPPQSTLPTMELEVQTEEGDINLECQTLLYAAGRKPNISGLGLDAAGVKTNSDGIIVNDLLQTANPDIFAIGDCVSGVPRLTHLSGEMAKMAVQNALFGDSWKLSSLVVPQVTYTEPEVATVGLSLQEAGKKGVLVDSFVTSLEHNDRCILEGESSDGGFVSVICARGSDKVLGATIVAGRAGEMVAELALAIKEKVGLESIGRSIHSYPTSGEAVMGCGLAYIRSKWATLS
ncbi:MAG: hypothetical protein SGPRY_002767 [Prymnesium sp.]